MDERVRNILCDPQTSGSLLIAADNENANSLSRYLKEQDLYSESIGENIERRDPLIEVR